MRISVLAARISACCLSLAALSPPSQQENRLDAVGYHAAGSFASPGVTVRPKFRYWLPDASINPKLMADDIAQLANRGSGGTELLNYFRFPAKGITPSDWDVYGYGAPGYSTIVKEFLKAHKAAGIVFDFAGSANGCVPAKKGDPGLSWELFPYSTTINGNFTGKIPGWGKGDLISIVTYAIINISTAGPDFHGPFGWGKTYPEYTISEASLTDVTSLGQTTDGTINVTLSKVPNAQYYVLEAYYARQPLGRELDPWSASPETIFQNGSVAVDHFSAAGAKVITNFLEDYVLDEESKTLFKEVGRYFWEDSIEISGGLYWTPGLEQKFQDIYQYDIRLYIPILLNKNGYMTQSPSASFVIDTADRGVGILSDFRNLLTILSKTYTDYMSNWSTEALGMEFSGQWGYNFPIDMLQVIPNINVPEAETLSFSNDIDGFLQFSGPADLSGKSVLSIELGADQYKAYTQSWSSLLYDANHAFAGGINQVVIHGAVYSHNFTNTTWPSYTSHNYEYAAPHSRHQPAWDVGYQQALGYLGRVQWILQSGVPKVDLIFWDKQTAQNAYPTTLYDPDDLTKAGYSYEYLSPENFNLEEAFVQGGVFAPERQEAKVLIIRNNDTLTPNGVEHLAKFAASGLPIIFHGDLPTTWATANKTAISFAQTLLNDLLKLNTVHQYPNETLATKVTSIGVIPRVQIKSNGTYWTRWREIFDGDTYIFIYNDGAFSTGEITFAVRGTAYLMNPWTGTEELVAQYVTDNNSTTIPFTLNSRQTAILRFSRDVLLKTHVVSSSRDILGFNVTKNGAQILAKVTASSLSSVVLSSGRTVAFSANDTQPAYSLTNWTLTLEHWLPQEDLYDLEPDARKVNATLNIKGSNLLSWYNLGYRNVSGIGYYSTDFQWRPSGIFNESGAQLIVPPISHGLVGTLNGKNLPEFDITDPVVDISSHLVLGTNSLVLKASSTLMNTLAAYWSQLRTVGVGASHDYDFYSRRGLGPQQHGIIGEVKIVPYVLVQVA